jgi:hypothetical protein
MQTEAALEVEPTAGSPSSWIDDQGAKEEDSGGGRLGRSIQWWPFGRSLIQRYSIMMKRQSL